MASNDEFTGRDTKIIKYILLIFGVGVLIMIGVVIFDKGDEDKYSTEQYVNAQDLVPKINDRLRVGSFDVVITNAKREGQTVTLEVSVRNVENKADTLYSDSFKLRDDLGRVYDSHLSIAFASINPGIEKTGDLVFEVPESAENLVAEISEDPVSLIGNPEYQTVDIQL